MPNVQFIAFAIVLGFLLSIVVSRLLGLDLLSMSANKVVTSIDGVTKKRIKYENIHTLKNNRRLKYRQFVSSIMSEVVRGGLLGVKVALPFEIYNTILFLIAFSVAIIAVALGASLIIGVAIIPSVVMTLNALVFLAVHYRIERYNSLVLDSLDFICPQIADGMGIKEAIGNQLSNIPLDIRPYYSVFVDRVDYEGKSFVEAITMLNEDLGPMSDEFTRKAIVFHNEETDGMASIFVDLVKSNEDIRTVNVLKTKKFAILNKEFYLKSLLVYGFAIALMFLEDTKEVIKSVGGSIVLAILLVASSYMFLQMQTLQGAIHGGGN